MVIELNFIMYWLFIHISSKISKCESLKGQIFPTLVWTSNTYSRWKEQHTPTGDFVSLLSVFNSKKHSKRSKKKKEYAEMYTHSRGTNKTNVLKNFWITRKSINRVLCTTTTPWQKRHQEAFFRRPTYFNGYKRFLFLS